MHYFSTLFGASRWLLLQELSRCTVLWMSKTTVHFLSHLARFSLEWEIFQIKVVEKIKTNISRSITFFFRKLCRLWDNVQKYCTAWRTPDDNMAHAHCMLDTWGYKHTLRLCNTYCVSTATVVARTRLIVTFYVRKLPILLFFWNMHHVNRE